jgi:hybrid cluster-associated redox disulfide protein
MRVPQLDDPDLPLSELMTHWPQTIPVFVRHNMLCVGCLIGPFHTLIDACAEYHLDYDAFMAELIASVTV